MLAALSQTFSCSLNNLHGFYRQAVIRKDPNSCLILLLDHIVFSTSKSWIDYCIVQVKRVLNWTTLKKHLHCQNSGNSNYAKSSEPRKKKREWNLKKRRIILGVERIEGDDGFANGSGVGGRVSETPITCPPRGGDIATPLSSLSQSPLCCCWWWWWWYGYRLLPSLSLL